MALAEVRSSIRCQVMAVQVPGERKSASELVCHRMKRELVLPSRGIKVTVAARHSNTCVLTCRRCCAKTLDAGLPGSGASVGARERSVSHIGIVL